MYISVSDAGPAGAAPDSGRIVRLRINEDGSAGKPVPVVQKVALQSVDGIAFDVFGTLWAAINSNKIGTVRHGEFRLPADNPGWLDCPTMVAFGTTLKTRTNLFVSNGGFNNGTPNIVSVDVGVRGLRLPAE
jgi:hypothetical protein